MKMPTMKETVALWPKATQEIARDAYTREVAAGTSMQAAAVIGFGEGLVLVYGGPLVAHAVAVFGASAACELQTSCSPPRATEAPHDPPQESLSSATH